MLRGSLRNGFASVPLLLLGACGGSQVSNMDVTVINAVTPTPAVTVVTTPAPLTTTGTLTSVETASPAATEVPVKTTSPIATDLSSLKLHGVLVQAGDSIAVGLGADGFAAFDHLNLGGDIALHNVSVSGRVMADGFAYMRWEMASILPDHTLPYVLLIEQGTNDLGRGTSAETLYDTASSFVASAKAAGFYVVLNTILPRSDAAWNNSKEGERVRYNNLVRLNAAGADAINDVAADVGLGDGTNPARSIYYSDGLHLTQAGQVRLIPMITAAVVPLLQRTPRAPQ